MTETHSKRIKTYVKQRLNVRVIPDRFMVRSATGSLWFRFLTGLWSGQRQVHCDSGSWPVYGQVSDRFIVIQKHNLKWSEWKHADSLMLKHYSSCWFNAFSCSRRSTFLCLRVIWQMFYLPFKIFSIFLRLLNSFGLNSYCLVGITHVIYENVAMLQE